MKPKSVRSRKSAVIPNSRWLAYATAGAASAFAGPHSAEATIHYRKINQRFTQCYGDVGTFQLDQFSGDFIRFRHSLEFCGTDYGGGAYFSIGGVAGAAFAGRPNTCTTFREPASVSRLDFGQFIEIRPFAPGQSGILAIASHPRCQGDGDWVGQFDGHRVGFIGFKFNNGSGDQYGWARIKMQRGVNQNFELVDYAFGDVGDHVRAGQTSSNEKAPDKGSLGWLALGAAGLAAWRKRRSRRETLQVS